MKKGHRRTNSQTLGLSRQYTPTFERAIQKQQSPFEFTYHQQKPQHQYPSIQSLIQKSSTNFAQRVLYIENLQQPNNVENSKGEFAFGKGINYKLSNFKLNMGEIPQVPKSNESTSLQGQNKLEILEKQTFFTHETCRTQTPTQYRASNQLSKPVKFQPKHMKTSSAVTIKKFSKLEKPQKPQPKLQIKSVAENQHKQNPLKRPKHEYQIQKKTGNSGKEFLQINQVSGRIQKQSYLIHLLGNEHKKKKKSSLV